MSYSVANLSHVHLIDCPGCKYGTLMIAPDETMRCIDCKRDYSIDYLRKLGVLPLRNVKEK